jgi:hypothetical protein
MAEPDPTRTPAPWKTESVALLVGFGATIVLMVPVAVSKGTKLLAGGARAGAGVDAGALLVGGLVGAPAASPT